MKHAGVVCLLLVSASAGAQQPLTRADAVAAAVARGARVALARADTAASAATLAAARMLQNPTASASYSKSAPQYHASLDLPLDFLWLNGVRAAAAREALAAARFRFALERATAQYEADTAYTAALAARAHARLSRRNAIDADSLRRIAAIRRDAGDASDLDVELATVSAGQAANAATDDSLAAIAALLDLQAAIGLPADRVMVTPTDSLLLPDAVSPADSGRPLAVAAAEATLRSEERSISVARRSAWATPSVTMGFETGDPAGDEPGILPLVGFSVPLPLFNRNGPGVALATAARERARTELAVAEREGAAGRARALRDQQTARARAARDQALLASAERVASMSLTAYAEGASPLAGVLEARRAARDALGRYIDDLAAANDAAAAVRLFTLTDASR